MRQISGYVARGFEPLRDAFAATLAEDAGAGSSLCIVRGGETVVDVWGGSDPRTGEQFDEDSTTIVFSCTKGAVVACLLWCVESGLLDLDNPVAEYWPDFAREGKDTVSVRDVASHLAGMPVLGLTEIEDLADWNLLTRRLANRAPDFAPRSRLVYHPISWGYLVGEVIRRVSHRSVGTLFREQLAQPFELSMAIGMPAANLADYRPAFMAPSVRAHLAVSAAPAFSAAGIAEAEAAAEVALLLGDGETPPGAEPFNAPEFLAAEVPASNGCANARGLAGMYAALLGGGSTGEPFLKPQTLTEASREVTAHIPVPEENESDPTFIRGRWGTGFELPKQGSPMLGDGSFGHGGLGGSLGFAHPETGIAFAFVPTALQGYSTRDPRSAALVHALADAL